MGNRFVYDVVINALPSFDKGFQNQIPELIVIHHTGTNDYQNTDVKSRLRDLNYTHIFDMQNSGFACHFYIPMDDSDKIYICRYLDHAQFHSGNFYVDKKSIAILIEGDLEHTQPTQKQLYKLKQILDDIPSFLDKQQINLDPYDDKKISICGSKKLVGTVFCHFEVIERGFYSKSCGRYLYFYVSKFRKYGRSYDWKLEDVYFDGKDSIDLPRTNKMCFSAILYAKNIYDFENKLSLYRSFWNLINFRQNNEN
ncbi:MAG: N-acetylmuramoyl-L-alanine amidase [Candidatus Dojkabacteria bacterium]|nr:N-acetylmuramoyl-L-alanine amidase [Candidatus Dojkabacteria bacterium]